MLSKTKLWCLILAFAPGAAFAQDASKNLTLLGIPSATTAPAGVAFGQVSRSTSFESNGEDRTVLAFGIGFGDANEGLGGQLTAVGAPSTSNFDSFTYFGAKVSRRLNSFENPSYLGLTIDRIAAGGEASDVDPSVSLVFTRFGTLATETDVFPTMLTIGAGSHVRNEQEDPGLLFGAGIGLSPNVGISGAWSGEHVDFGASVRFEKFKNARASFVISDVFNLQDNQRLTIGISWSIETGQRR